MQPFEVDHSGSLVQQRYHRKIVRHHAIELFGYGREQIIHRQLGNQGVGDLEQHPHPVAFPQERLPGEIAVDGDRDFRRNPLQKCQCFLAGPERRGKSEPE